MSERISRREFLKWAWPTVLSPVASKLSPERGKSFKVITRFETGYPIYALTIDDCWYPDALVAMKDFLRGNHLQATFFPVGFAAIACDKKYPGIFAELVEDGHSIGYHSMSHPPQEEVLAAGAGYWNEDYRQWKGTLRSVLGSNYFSLAVKPYARAPYGDFTQEFLSMCRTQQLTAFSWSSGSGWLQLDIPLEKGDIMVLHATDRVLALMKNHLSAISGGLKGLSIACFEDITLSRYFDFQGDRARKRKSILGGPML